MEKPGLLIVDVQEKLFPHIDRSCEILDQICFALEAAKALDVPIVVSEQMPEKLGGTVRPIVERLPPGQQIFSKSTFSAYRVAQLQVMPIETWILVGIEAHICVWQTAKDLLAAGKKVIILNDAVSSRSLFDFSTAMGELRDAGARISSTETVLYEMIGDANSDAFEAVLPLIKAHA